MTRNTTLAAVLVALCALAVAGPAAAGPACDGTGQAHTAAHASALKARPSGVIWPSR